MFTSADEHFSSGVDLTERLAPSLTHMDVDQNLLAAMTKDRKAVFEAHMAKTVPTFKGN